MYIYSFSFPQGGTVQLLGMTDSPYVRRVAVTMQLLGLVYEHRPISVFRTYDQFKAVNPVVRIPTLVCDDGEQLMDSHLIIDYLEGLAGRSLMPEEMSARRRALRLLGLATVACEKTGQVVHEYHVRTPELRSGPWLARVLEQLVAALRLLEIELTAQPFGEQLDQASLTVAITWRFTQIYVKDSIVPMDFPALAAHSAWAERQAAFRAVPAE
jgi:glutathione S-transferase